MDAQLICDARRVGGNCHSRLFRMNHDKWKGDEEFSYKVLPAATAA